MSAAHVVLLILLRECEQLRYTQAWLDTLVLPWANTEMMGVLLAEVSQRHPHEFILLMLDGAGWHRAKRLQVPADMKLISLPAWNS